MSNSSNDLPILTVSQLSNAIKLSLESTFPLIWLQGEVSNSKLHTSGHFYFSLKDANAQISALMYRADASQVKMLPKDGAQVIVRGELNVYPPGGKYQIVIKEMRPVGVGELLLKLEELKNKLHKKGYFRSDRKKPIPKTPRCIGVVTSPTGAAIQDMLKVLSRRFSGFHLIINPVRVQGEGAAQEIAQAIRQFSQHNLVDVMIIGRGGGSIEDLWAFNEEIVADAIYQSPIPIISAVGHETDHCIADYVADVRAPTPSAAAEIVIAEKSQQLKHLDLLRQRFQQALSHHVRHCKGRLAGICRHPLLQSPYGILGPWMQKLDILRQNSDEIIKQHLVCLRLKLDGLSKHSHALKPTNKIAHFKQQLSYYDKTIHIKMGEQLKQRKSQIGQAKNACLQSWKSQQSHRRRLFDPLVKQKQIDAWISKCLSLEKERLSKLAESLHSVNPKNLLGKGYSILFAEKDRSVITSINALEKGMPIRILVSDGQASSTINEVFQREP